MSFRHLFFASIVSIALSATSEAVDIFGNGNRASNATSGANNFNGQNAWAIPFTPGNSSLADRNLLGAWVLVGGNAEITVSYDVKIYADAGTNQGPTGVALATGTRTSLSGSPLGWNFVTFAVPVQLTANGNYYVSVEEATGLGGFAWAEPTVNPTYTNLGSGSAYALTVGGSQNLWFRTGSTWTASVNPVTALPLGVQLVTVPEPSTILLGGISCVTIAGIARRRRNLR